MRRFFALFLLFSLNTAHADPDLSKVKLVIGDQVRGLWLLSQPSGAMKDTPYTLEWANFLTPAPLFEAVKSGDVDFLPALDNLILAAAVNGTPLKVIATGSDHSERGTAILARAASDIHEVKDLKGREVMVSTIRGGTADNLLTAALKEAGVAQDSVKVGYLLRSDAFAAFSNGHADVWVTDDPYTARAQQLGARVLRTGEGLNKGLSFYAASDKALADPAKRAALADFVQRLQRAAQWNQAHLDTYAPFYAKQTGLPEDIARITLERRGLLVFKGIDPATRSYTGTLSAEYARRGLFKQPASVEPFFDTGVLPPQELVQ